MTINYGSVAFSSTSSTDSRPSRLEIFWLRAWAQAYLARIGELDFYEAIDIDAVTTGLVAEIGQDAVQTILAQAFGGAPLGAAIDIIADAQP
jgi:hypothetical protein